MQGFIFLSSPTGQSQEARLWSLEPRGKRQSGLAYRYRSVPLRVPLIVAGPSAVTAVIIQPVIATRNRKQGEVLSVGFSTVWFGFFDCCSFAGYNTNAMDGGSRMESIVCLRSE